MLLVEDNPGDSGLIAEAVQSDPTANHRLTVATSLAGASAALGRAEYDALLLDPRLPDGSGVDCVTAMRAAATHLPIVVLTGIDQHEVALACLAAGAQDYIAKDELQARTLHRAIAYAVARMREFETRLRADSLQRRLAAIVEASSGAIVSGTPAGRITS